MEFNVEELRAYFLTRIIGRRIEYYEELESTNTEALRLALENAPEGTVVIADAQSEGRGRLDRIWESPPSLNLYLSVVLRPDIPAAASSLIPLMVGVAVADVISKYGPGPVRLKWPNDVLIDGKKICGILTECELDRIDVAIRLFESLERWYRIFLNGGEAAIREKWLQYADIIGKRIEVVFKSETQRGTVVGLDEHGALLLEGETGVQQVLAGDVYIERL